jgi:MFS transporter, LPLT family, lysophospholipid transporter
MDQGFDRARHLLGKPARAVDSASGGAWRGACYNPPASKRRLGAARRARRIAARDTMKKGFSTIMSAQFFSSLADNALLVAAIELLRLSKAPAWQTPALAPMFALFYVLLAPFVGAFSDALPKGRVMFISNSVKVVGCLMMLFGGHPLLAYAVVGLGAAAYSPAKYGILTELLPPSQLVKGNGWIEGLTVGSIILGILLGGQLVGPRVAPILLGLDFPFIQTSVDTAPEAAISVIVFLYVIAALFNLYIPRTTAPLQPLAGGVIELVRDFSHCNARLWADKLGQITLATTTLLWGIFGNLRLIVFAWAAAALGYGTTQASSLAGVVIIGSAFGAVVASMAMKLDRALTVLPLGIGVGFLMIGLNVLTNVWVAAPFLVVLGALCGFLIVPMNALLQHRGHNLMGAGRSIAVQNFNEQACILGLGAFYAGVTKLGLSAFGAITIFGLLVAGIMELVRRWHQRNLVQHGAEVQRLLAIARSDHP